MIQNQHILLRAPSGWGKTTLVGYTLPGRTLIIETDTGGMASLARVDTSKVTVWECPTDEPNLNEALRTQDPKKIHPTQLPATEQAEPRALHELKRLLKALTAPQPLPDCPHYTMFDNIVLDTISGLTDIVTNRILWLSRRPSPALSGPDYVPVQATLKQQLKMLLRIQGPNIIMCAHEYTEKPDGDFTFDTGTPKIKDPRKNRYKLTIAAPGQCRDEIPAMGFGHGFRLNLTGAGSTMKYMLQTRPETPDVVGIKTAWPWLPMEIDMTIGDWAHPERFGFARLFQLAEAGLSK